MSRLISQGATLTASRLSNFAVLLLSPLLLVRILDVDSYGQYQEFMIYATFLVTLCEFGLDSSLTYFLPRQPDRERSFVSQTSLLVLTISIVALSGVLLARPLLVELTTYDFSLPLVAYVFCFVNLNWLEFYWIAKRRTDLVLYYSLARLVVRVSVLLAVAYATRDVRLVLWSLVMVEALRLLLVGLYAAHAGLLRERPDAARIRTQLRFASPMGAAVLAQYAGSNIGKLFIGSVIGPAALAYYTVATYLLPIVHLVRGSIAEVVFPELVRAREDRAVAFQLWSRTNVVFCALLFPAFVILAYHAEFVITTLFTQAYAPAVPIFLIYLLWLLRRCFNLDVLLRTSGQTGFVLAGTMLSLAVNLVLMVVLYRWLGFIGPAIAFVASEILLELYYASRVRRHFQIAVSALIDWRGLLRVASGCAAAFPLLVLANHLPAPALAQVLFASVAFVAAAWWIAHKLGVEDIGRITAFALSIIQRSLEPNRLRR